MSAYTIIHYLTTYFDSYLRMYLCTYLVGCQRWPTDRALQIDAQFLYSLRRNCGNRGDVVSGCVAGAKVSMLIDTFAPITKQMSAEKHRSFAQQHEAAPSVKRPSALLPSQIETWLSKNSGMANNEQLAIRQISPK